MNVIRYGWMMVPVEKAIPWNAHVYSYEQPATSRLFDKNRRYGGREVYKLIKVAVVEVTNDASTTKPVT